MLEANGIGTHVSLVPLPEGGGIDFDNGALDQGLGSEQLVVGGVVDLSYPKQNQAISQPNLSSSLLFHDTHNVDDSSLPGAVLGSPSEVTRVQSHRSVLDVSTSSPDLVNPLGTQLGHGGLTTQLELSLLSVLGPSGTRCRALVARIPGNTLHERKVSPSALLSRALVFLRVGFRHGVEQE